MLNVNLLQKNATQEIPSSPHHEYQGDLCHLYESEDTLSLPLQAEQCQADCGLILTHRDSVLILEAERKKSTPQKTTLQP